MIKPLSDAIGAIPGISGATILANGSISLILDVHSLVSNGPRRTPVGAHAAHRRREETLLHHLWPLVGSTSI